MRFLTALLVGLVSLSTARAAESAAVVVFPAEGVAPADAALLERAAHVALTNLSSFETLDVEVTADAGCVERPGYLTEMAKLSGTEHLLVLIARPSPRNTVALEGVHVTPAGVHFMSEARSGIDPFAAEDVIQGVVMGVLPRYGARGFGGLEVKVAGSGPGGIKIDGQAVAHTPDSGPIPVVAGVHEVDVTLPSGRSVLYRQTVAPGMRQVLEVKPFSAAPAPGSSGEGIRTASYGVFSAGAVAVAASLIFGGLARSSLNGVSTCTGDIRDCAYMEEARSRHARGERFGNVGNGLGVLGGVLMVSGGGLFAFDLLGGDQK